MGAGRRPNESNESNESNEEAELRNTQLLIGGQRTAARSGETEEVRSPFDGSIVGVASTQAG